MPRLQSSWRRLRKLVGAGIHVLGAHGGQAAERRLSAADLTVIGLGAAAPALAYALWPRWPDAPVAAEPMMAAGVLEQALRRALRCVGIVPS